MAKTEKSEVKAGPVITAGTEVHLVLASGKHAPARCIRAKGRLIDLEAQVGEETVTITGSPLDETGKVPDSWHLPEEAAKAE